MNRILIAVAMLTAAALLSACPRKAATEAENNVNQANKMSADKLPPTETPETTPPAEDAVANPCNPCAPAEGDAANPCGTPAEGEAANPCNPCKPADAPTDLKADEKKPAAGTTSVVLETTKGNIVLEVHADWSPLGAARFLELVNAKFYDGAPFFRVIPGFMMQTGLAADPGKNKEWGEKRIADDPMVPGISNTSGMVSFAMAGPNTRTTQFFINFGDNSRLDADNFSPFAKVLEGQDIVDSIYVTGEDSGGARQGMLQQPGGLEQIKKLLPEMDFIKKAYVRK
jgi:peptidyl-prolyl cis-trans isomerase A (cyclophilin A)